MRDFTFTRAAVLAILEHWHSYEWTVQGFGMLRTYLDPAKVYRLNIWHSSLAVPGVSIIHDHPWDFTSVVLAGEMTNIRYDVCSPMQDSENHGALFHRQKIRTGEGGGPDGRVNTVALRPRQPEIVEPGFTYNQCAGEIHATSYVDGSVTLNERHRRGTGEHAYVFWPYGERWVDADPRKAKIQETIAAVDAALFRLRGAAP